MKCLADATCKFRPKNRSSLAIHMRAAHGVSLKDIEQKMEAEKNFKADVPPPLDVPIQPLQNDSLDSLLQLAEEIAMDKDIPFDIRLSHANKIMLIRENLKKG